MLCEGFVLSQRSQHISSSSKAQAHVSGAESVTIPGAFSAFCFLLCSPPCAQPRFLRQKEFEDLIAGPQSP